MSPEELLARECIRHTMACYTMAGDRLRVDEFLAVFTDDAVLESTGAGEHDSFRYEGIAESALAQMRETGELPPAGEMERAMGPGHFDYSPLIGRSNPLAPPIVLASSTAHHAETLNSGTTAFAARASMHPATCIHG